MTTLFQYHPDIVAAFPTIYAGVVWITNLDATHPRPNLDAAYRAEQSAIKARIGATPLSDIPSLAAWRAAFRQFSVDPTQYRSAPESLLRRLTKKGDIPAINPLVDLGNLVSIRYALPVAVFDSRGFTPPITVQFATGAETFLGIGQREADQPAPGEVIFAGAGGQITARRWCWRQSLASAAQSTTTSALIVTEAQHTDGPSAIAAALDDLQALLAEHFGVTAASAVVTAANPTFKI